MPTPAIAATPDAMPPAPASERHQVIISTDLIRRLDDWRRRQADIPNKSEAIRRLLETALDADEQNNARPKPPRAG